MKENGPDLEDLERRMNGANEVLHHEFAGLRTGRASTSLLEHVQVDAYGAPMPISQVGTVSAPDARTLTVQVWDQSLVAAVEKAIQNAGLGLNPFVDAQMVRVPIPELNQERRVEMTKIASKYAESARVAVRNVRRDGMDRLKKLEKDHQISKDEHRDLGEDIQKMTDNMIKKIDDSLNKKEQDILAV
jgi:ribosome recycling factor